MRVTKARMPYYIWYLQAIMEENLRSVEQLVTDEQFLAWYKSEDQEAVNAWEARMQADPSLSQLSGEARRFLDRILIPEKGLDATQIEAAKQKFERALAQNKPTPVRRIFLRWAAAAILILSIGATAWWFTQKTDIHYLELATGFGETRELQLPDGSLIQLNADTKLRYPENFVSGPREVWVDGEAFLEVKKTDTKELFVVHTQGYDITVKGTRFNVLAREGRQQVLLTEGAIDLDIKGRATESLQPGDWIIIHAEGIEKKQADGKALLAWKEKQLMFEKTPLSEVAQRIQEYYGLEVKVDKGLEQKAVSGIFPNNDLDILLNTLSASGEFALTREGSLLRFTKK